MIILAVGGVVCGICSKLRPKGLTNTGLGLGGAGSQWCFGNAEAEVGLWNWVVVAVFQKTARQPGILGAYGLSTIFAGWATSVLCQLQAVFSLPLVFNSFVLCH